MKVLLTGAHGFIGCHLSAAMRADHEVVPLVRHARSGEKEIEVDLAAPLARERLPAQVDVVVHAAGLVGAEANASSLCRRVNVDATRELLEYAVSAGAGAFLLFSSGGVYRPSRQWLTEDSTLGPIDPYTASKLEAENVAGSFNDRIHVTILRPFFPYGPNQRKRLVPALAERVRAGVPIRTPAPDRPRLTPIYIDDLVEQAVRLLERPGSRTLNVAGPESVSVREIAAQIASILGRDVAFEIDATLPSGDWCGMADRAIAATDFAPATTVAEGLRRTFAEADGSKMPSKGGAEPRVQCAR